MGRADIGKDIARASLCLHLNNKTLHVRPPVTPPRQRALTLPEPRLSRFFPQLLLLSRNVASIREPTRSNSRILAGNFMGTAIPSGSLHASVRRGTVFPVPPPPPPNLEFQVLFLFFFIYLFIYLSECRPSG